MQQQFPLLATLFPLLATLFLLLGFSLLLPASERLEPPLHRVFADYFPVGMGVDRPELQQQELWQLATHHANRVTVENAMKPSNTQPEPGVFTFARADGLVAAAEVAGMAVHGHTLVWYRQTADWMFAGTDDKPLSAEQARARLRAHIHGVMGHYRGRVASWDVVNEALADGDGEEDFRDSPWYQALGPDYVVEAFRFAAEADPDARLYYNDYNLETEPKRSRALRLIKRVQDAGVRIDGIGIQAHVRVDGPSISEIERSIKAFAELGLQVHISELDVSVHPWRTPGSELIDADRRFEDGLDEAMAQQLSERYRQLFALFIKHHQVISAVTFWNTHDGRSWLNNFPVRGRVDHPLLFDRQLQPKPAFWAVVETAVGDDGQ